MELTKENTETATKIIDIFVQKKYTVENAKSVLSYVRNTLPSMSTVRYVNADEDGTQF